MSTDRPAPQRRPARRPWLAAWLVAARLPRAEREFVLGDLDEAFRMRAHADPHAARWYWWQAFSILTTRWPTGRPALPAPRGDPLMTSIWPDIRVALRSLRRSPLYAILAVATFAVGIGATTALYSVARPILLDGPPYPGADRLVMIFERDRDSTQSNVGWLTIDDLRRESRSIASAAALSFWSPTIRGDRDAEQLNGQRVSWTYFATLGVRPFLGRDFRVEDDRMAARDVVILTHRLWSRRFGADSGIVGRTVTIAGRSHVVLGVLPRDYENVLSPQAEIFAPLGYDASYEPACRTCRHLRMVARIRDGVTPAEAAAEIDALMGRMRAAHPSEYASIGAIVVSVGRYIARVVRPAILALLGAVALLLAVACANVANLVVGRTIEREGEWAVRTALGAGIGRLVRQVTLEALILALLGGAGGLLLAWAGVAVLPGLSATPLPRADHIRISAPVIAFAFVASFLAAVMAGMIPAFVALRGSLAAAIRVGTRQLVGRGGRHRLRGGLVVTEVSLALMLLTGAGLLLRSLGRVLAVDTGFASAGIETLSVTLSGPRYNDDAIARAYYRDVLTAVRAVPGVTQAAVVSQLPLGGNFDSWGLHRQDKPAANPETDPSVQRFTVSPEYLRTMGIRVLRGRGLTDADRGDAPPVVLINERLAHGFFGGEDPIGKRVQFGDPTSPWRTIVGVVHDVRHLNLDGEQEFQFYIPIEQNPFVDGSMTLVARAAGSRVDAAIARAVRGVDPAVAISGSQSMDDVLAKASAARRFTLVLLGVFAGVALLLSAAGLYGVIAAGVTERTREIGVRSALGASRGRILAMVVRQGFLLTAIGLAIGIAGSLSLGNVVRAFLYDVTPTDPLTFGLAVIGLSVVGLLACLLPAARASRVDPAIALRSP